jgi:hypothetical protein
MRKKRCSDDWITLAKDEKSVSLKKVFARESQAEEGRK